MNRTHFDVAIVGAGPAGAWAAYLLARRGARVAILDPSHPREKPCGGGVTGRALSLVAGAIDVSQLPAVSIERAIFRDAGSRSAEVPMRNAGEHPSLIVASRAEFDARLLTAAVAAGAVHTPVRVRDLTRDAGGFQLETSGGALRAERVIGADGANSLVRRRVARAFTRSQLSIATGFFAHGVSSASIVLEIAGDPPGYLWSFPRPDHLAVGICAQATAGVSAAALRARTARWIAAIGIAPGARLEPYSWPIPSLTEGDIATLDVAGPKWMLIGDAAGLVDPITREGIFFALESARIAADAVAGSPQPERTYSEALRAGVLDELAHAARFKAGFFRPRFTRLLLDALVDSASVRGIMADLVAGTQGYRGLKWRLAGTLELGLAWRALTSR